MIYGETVRLRKIERDDLPHYVAWLNDPAVRQGLSISLPISSAEEASWYEKTLQKPTQEQPLAIDVGTGGGWRHIGSTSLFDFDWQAHSAEFGLMIGDRNFWGRGIGSEVTQLVLQHAFETLNLNRVWLRVFKINTRAQRVYEKSGFVYEGTLRQAIFLDGQYVDVELMSVLREEWVKSSNNKR